MSAGDVYTYALKDRWCREGIAIETEKGTLLDTFWHTSPRDFMVDHYLTPEEVATAELLGNLDDYERFERGGKHYNAAGFDGYAESDRFTVTSQHGLTAHRFIRKGAEPSRSHIIAKARKDVSDALAKRDDAMRSVESARAMLHYAESGKWPWEQS